MTALFPIVEPEGNRMCTTFHSSAWRRAIHCGLCKHCDDELVYSGVITRPWHFTFVLKHVKQSSTPKAIFDKLLEIFFFSNVLSALDK